MLPDTQPTISIETRLSNNTRQLKPIYRELSRMKLESERNSPDTIRDKMRSV
jgi:hypothetical protein